MLSCPRISLLLILATFFGAARLGAQAGDNPIVNPAAGAKFAPIPNAPDCFTVAVEKGDPAKGPSVILARFAPHCGALSLAHAQRDRNGRKRSPRDSDEGRQGDRGA